ncbi:amino acid adenylation domain-containing protein [Streptomyces sp. NPDC088788]|uniref:non-ribosomal peptide synthetase n=1 Tax=Streptomyces sp. NPDC088788 TaxID=3365898 RepID=UPI003811F134
MEIPKGDVTQILKEPSPAQQQIWLQSELKGKGRTSHMALALEWASGPPDRAVLSRALRCLLDRHEALRTRCITVAGTPRLVVEPVGTDCPLSVKNLMTETKHGHDIDSGDRLANLAAREERAVRGELELVEQGLTQASFDLAAHLPVRATLVLASEGRHILFLEIHPIAADLQSLAVIGRDLAAIVHQGAALDAPALPSLSLSYADHAERQREWLSSDAADVQRAYWRQALAGVPELLELPTDRPRPIELDVRGGRVPVRLDGELSHSLAEFSLRAGCTLAETVLAGWALVLGRHSGQQDIVIGTPDTGRGRTAAERGERDNLVGPFAHLLALRIDLTPGPSAAELAGRVCEVVRRAREHSDLPLEEAVELMRPSRSLARASLFQVLYAWQEPVIGRGGDPRGDEAEMTYRLIPSGNSEFDFALSLRERDGRIEGVLEFATALFDTATAELYVRHLRQVLVQFAACPELPAAELSVMDESERQRVLVDFNDTFLAPTGTGLVERFQAQVALRPEQTAVVHCGERLTYASVDRRAERLAHALISRGVGSGKIVGLHAGLSVDMVVGILAVLKAGCAYLPLDPGLPAERLAEMVEDSGAAAVLSDAGAPPEGWVPAISPDRWLSLGSAESGVRITGVTPPASGGRHLARHAPRADHEPRAVVAVHPDDLAYVIYTSGSTGRPKGVAATHRGILNLLDHWQSAFGATPGLPSAMWPSFSFDASVQEFMLPLTTGGELHLVPQGVRDDPEALMVWLREHHIVDVLLPPAYVKWISEAPEERLAGVELRCIRTGLQPLPEDVLHRLERARPGLRIFNGYGPTETALYCTSYVDPGLLARRAPIGRPVSNMRTYVLDERLEPAPIGVTGELYIAGAGLARGYLNSPRLTAERFLPDPFVPGARMYRSGDLVRWLPEGNLLYVGRADHQLKLRGFRVEPGEIEAMLLEEPGVLAAAVLPDGDAGGEPYLVAAVVTKEAAHAAQVPNPRSTPQPRTPAQWRSALARRLPSHMIPSFFVELPQLPQTPNGKLDRTEVLALSRAARSSQVNQDSPRDHVEMRLYQIWQALLLHPDIGIRDSFFDIGGTSVSAIKLAYAIREEFGRSVPVKDLLLHPTIEELGGILRRDTASVPPSNLITFRSGLGGRGQVVCVHPAGGTAFCYLSLAKALPEALGIHGIQSRGINPGEDVLPTVDAMADAYLKLIEPLLGQPGPLVLTGLSYGGLVVHEMGRKLAVGGHDRLSVVLLDTPGTDDRAAKESVVPVDLAEFRSKLIRFNGMYPGIDDKQIEQYFHVYNHNRRTTVDHIASTTTARTVLMQASQGATDEELRMVREFWGRRAHGPFEVEAVGCGHWDMLESTEVPRIAARIQAELADLASDPGTAQETARNTAVNGPEGQA